LRHGEEGGFFTRSDDKTIHVRILVYAFLPPFAPEDGQAKFREKFIDYSLYIDCHVL